MRFEHRGSDTTAAQTDDEGDAMDFHFATAFELIADAVPDEPALICGDTTRTWAEFDDRAARIARLLTVERPAVPARKSASTCTTPTSTLRRTTASSRCVAARST